MVSRHVEEKLSNVRFMEEVLEVLKEEKENPRGYPGWIQNFRLKNKLKAKGIDFTEKEFYTAMVQLFFFEEIEFPPELKAEIDNMISLLTLRFGESIFSIEYPHPRRTPGNSNEDIISPPQHPIRF
ncbi:MAG: hypothetical protein COV30_02150 [Candidatus Yanofskybacteria bacterium CG10_big_fil_rev_8_21_14_0_10_37_15]|uniref:Uncharacterized protein n=1 Tax=Candidatus Yanofskybacteria bacterium CG10_big_fil_rev_8_21_14_0_10_37_15 TaxID=1975097 RepID=A0A2H0R5X9_9BACT|nr:MAG: hypothetical protein COV30_02150 [Candidatus Yanofskybacteria bacterium CG10_big_fil_rev_8_21_14_0_10_37_15]